MARTDNDIINVRFILSGSISLDKERIESDPIWRNICLTYDLLPKEDFNISLLNEYLQHYIIRERILSDCPVTNGPGEVSLQQLIEETKEIE